MSNSKNGSIVGQIAKTLITLVVGFFVAKEGRNKWNEKKEKKNS